MAGLWRRLLRPGSAGGEAPGQGTPGEDTPGVLFVCMGNICRSPSAEGVMRHKLAKAGLAGRVRVDSAGTSGHHAGEPPDVRALRHAAQRGYDLAPLRARQVRAEDFHRFDLILAMDGDNLAWLCDRAPVDGRAELGLLMAHGLVHASKREVPDPYYGSAAGFEHVLDLLEDACDGLLRQFSALPQVQRAD